MVAKEKKGTNIIRKFTEPIAYLEETREESFADIFVFWHKKKRIISILISLLKSKNVEMLTFVKMNQHLLR